LDDAGRAGPEEKATLAELFLDAEMEMLRARKLIDAALRAEPKNPRYLALKKRLGGRGRPASKRSAEPVIIRGIRSRR
jgi:hypothetical protein